MNWRISDAKRCLRSHATFQRILDRGDNIVGVVQTIKYSGDIYTLRMFYLIHQFSYIHRTWIHAQSVQTTIQHVRLDASFIERFGKCANSQVRILTIHKVHLLESATVSFNTVEAAHVDNDRGYAFKLVFSWLELTRTLEHVSIEETELDFFLHIISIKILPIYLI